MASEKSHAIRDVDFRPRRARAKSVDISAGPAPAPATKPSPKGPKSRAKQSAPEPRPVIAPEPEEPDYEPSFASATWERSPRWVRLAGGVAVVAVILVASFEVVYSSKIMPGVSADGVDVSGLSRADAVSRITDRTTQYDGEVVAIAYGDSTLTIPVRSLNVQYDTQRVADLAYEYGHTGSLYARIRQQARALLGRSTTFAAYSYDDSALAPYLTQLDDTVVTPVENAALSFNNDQAQVTPAQPGTRLDLGRLATLISAALGATSTANVNAPVYQLQPDLATDPLRAASAQINTYLSGPVTISYNGVDQTVGQNSLISWIQVGPAPTQPFLQSLKLEDLYPLPASAAVSLDQTAIKAYVANLAHGIDQTPQNATLAMDANNQLQVVAPSRTGIEVDQAKAVADISASLNQPATDRTITLSTKVVPAPVNEDNLASLGITQLLSEGETYFPGSPADRLINVRAGAKRFNDVLLSPGEQFSFGKLLGDVGPQTGYVPELVIDGNHEDYQYGGGLCQVSTTAFRAALLAGLPIDERVNHAFAISYYTWPYGVPGVDATIYYPQVDFKFTNDTGHYILIQTIMNGVDLKFDFYGTKTKQGVVRGPTFVSGSNDATQPSHTVFYRDVEDLTGNVIKTDTFNTYYQPSTNFPIVKTFD